MQISSMDSPEWSLVANLSLAYTSEVNMNFSGVHTALVTPFTSDGALATGVPMKNCVSAKSMRVFTVLYRVVPREKPRP